MANELSQIAKAASGMNAATNNFREAADEHNENMSRILKDVHNVFASQKQQISSIGPQIQQALSDSQQGVTSQLSQTNSILNASLQAQYQVITQLQHLAVAIQSLGNQNSNVGNSSGSLFQKIGGLATGGKLNISNTAKVGLGALGISTVAGDMVAKENKMQTGFENMPGATIPKGGAPAGETAKSNKPASAEQKEYYDKMYSSLLKAAKEKGVPNPEVIAKLGATQTSLETGYGQHMVGNNAFGIKAGKNDTDSVSAGTQEFVNGKMVDTKQNFKSYKDSSESAGDYIDFLMKNPRYKDVLAAKSIDEAIAAQSKSGYATDPDYGSKLASIDSKMSGGATQTQVANAVTPQPNTAVPPPSPPQQGGNTPSGNGSDTTPISGGNNRESGGEQVSAPNPMMGRGGGELSQGGDQGGNGNLPDAELVSIGEGNHRLKPEAADAYKKMLDAAKSEGISWSVTDSYRTYDEQLRLAKQKGLYSQGGLAATPGTSNHGWGLAVDLGGGANQEGSKQNKWLQENAGKFGFSNIPREPWHWQYAGGGGGAASEGHGPRKNEGSFGFADQGQGQGGGGPFPELGNVGKISQGEIGHGVLGTAGFAQSGPMGMMESMLGGRGGGGGLIGAGVNILSSLLGGGNNEESGYRVDNRHDRGENLSRRGVEQTAMSELAREASMKSTGGNEGSRPPDDYRQPPSRSAVGMDHNTEKFFGNEFAPSWYAELKGAYPHDLKNVKFS